MSEAEAISEEAHNTEIIQADILNSTVRVGSGCPWNGQGQEPQWHNPNSTKVYDHIVRHHGPQLKPSQILGRMSGGQRDQGQWLSLSDMILAEQLTPKYEGRYIIDFHRPIGRVYHLDGRITENVTRINIRRKADGTLKYAYPVTNTFRLRSDVNEQDESISN